MKQFAVAMGASLMLSGCLTSTKGSGQIGGFTAEGRTLALAEVHEVIDYVKQQIRVFEYHAAQEEPVSSGCNVNDSKLPIPVTLKPRLVQLDVKTDHKGTVKLEAGSVLSTPPGIIASGTRTGINQATNTMSLLMEIKRPDGAGPPELGDTESVDWKDRESVAASNGLAQQLLELVAQLGQTEQTPPCFVPVEDKQSSNDTGLSITLSFVLSTETNVTGGYNFIVVKATAGDTRYAAYTNTVKLILQGKFSAK